MSEPASLYARLTFTADAYAAYRASLPATPSAFDDWQAWLDGEDMAGGSVLPAGVLASPPAGSRVDEVLDAWQRDAWMGAAPVVRAADGTCRIVLMQATENYLALVQLLAPLRGAGAWTTRDADDFILVTGFLWGDDARPMACLALGDGSSRFVEQVPAAWQAEAAVTFDAPLARLQQDADGG